MQLQPRSYQTEAVSCIYKYFEKQYGNPLVAMPTGTGKSVVIALFLESIFRQWGWQKVLILTHVTDLIQQNYDKLLTVWPTAPAGINSAGLKQRDILNAIIFAGIASVKNSAADFGVVHLLLIDEAHLVSQNEITMYRNFIAALQVQNPLLKVIGFTATPWRLQLGSLTEGGIFNDVCFDITNMHAFNRLIREGYLCPVVAPRTRLKLSVEGVGTKGGEFKDGELQKAVDREEITEAAIRESLEIGHDRNHWLIFCSGKDHCDNTARILSTLGFECGSVHSGYSETHNDNVKDRFKRGELRAIASMGKLTTGIDYPFIDFIVMLRPTQSAILWVQMLGRGTRPWHEKVNCLVADFAGNTKRLGPINDPVLPRKKGEKKGTAPTKECIYCGVENHASYRFCGGKEDENGNTPSGYCGGEFVFQTKLTAEASTLEIIKSDYPVTEIFKVDHITYTEHNKAGSPPSVKVSYFCKTQLFYEFLCFEHGGRAQTKAHSWWKLRTQLPTPITTNDALLTIDKITATTHVIVWINKQYPEVTGTCIDGTAFGTQDPTFELPTVQTKGVLTKTDFSHHNGIVEDDDIPF